MNTPEEFLSLLRADGGASLTPGMVDDLAREYPFFTLPSLVLLRRDATERTLDEPTRRRLIERVALTAPDPAALMALVEPDGDTLAGLYPPPRPTETTTVDAIDTFLATYGHNDPKEEALIERLIFNPTPDYSMVLEAEEEAATASSGRTLGASLQEASPSPSENAPSRRDAPQVRPAAPKPPRHEPAGTLSESLAMIYIRQKKYRKAYEMLQRKGTTAPSPHLADQLRFLEKVMELTGNS